MNIVRGLTCLTTPTLLYMSLEYTRINHGFHEEILLVAYCITAYLVY